jgi:hypothetical protein
MQAEPEWYNAAFSAAPQGGREKRLKPSGNGRFAAIIPYRPAKRKQESRICCRINQTGSEKYVHLAAI